MRAIFSTKDRNSTVDAAQNLKPHGAGESRRPFHDTLSSLYGDIVAGIVVAILSLPMTIPLGVLALAPLGPDYRTAGVIAGFHASIFAGFISALSGGSVLQISGPRASVSFIMATAISMALADPHLLAIGLPREEAALGIGFVVVFLAGLVQVVLGLMKLGRGIKFVPYPVLSGFKNGVGILIIVGQIPAALGLTSTLHWDTLWTTVSCASIGAVVVSLVTCLVMWRAPRWTAVPPIILALVTGMILDHVLRAIFGSESLGPLVGNIEGTFPLPIPILLLPWDNDILSILLRNSDRPRARGGGVNGVAVECSHVGLGG